MPESDELDRQPDAARAADPATDPTDPSHEALPTDDDPPRRRRRWRRWALGAAGLIVVAAVALVLTNRPANGDENATAARTGAEKTDAEKKADEPVPVELAAVEQGDVVSWISATANLLAEGEVTVVAEVEGKVARVAVDEGDWVAKGSLLALLDRGDAEIALEKARVREANAASVNARGEELAKDQLISREELEKRQTDLALTRQERKEAEWRLAKTEIRAPIAGRLSLRSTQPGRHVAAGDELFQITDADPLVARIFLPERDVLVLDEGRPARLSLDAAPDVVFAGRIRQISPVVDPATGTVKITVEAVSPPRQVRPGSFVTVKLVRERRPDAMLLPKNAVVRELQQAHVFVARADGDKLTAERRDVTLGLEEDDRVQALTGLAAGDQVVVAGQGSLKDGQAIRRLGDPAPAAAEPAAAASREG